MPPRASFLLSTYDARAATVQGLLIGAIVIAGLYFGREVLLPLALAIVQLCADAATSSAQADQTATSGGCGHEEPERRSLFHYYLNALTFTIVGILVTEFRRRADPRISGRVAFNGAGGTQLALFMLFLLAEPYG